MASEEASSVADPTASYLDVQQKVLAVYAESLNEALGPLAERYQQALAKLTEVQQGYLQELGRRVTTAYQVYAESVAAIPAGSAHLESTIEAYQAFAGKYGQYADPARWADLIAPAQERLEAALADAQNSENATAEAQQAIKAYYEDLNHALKDDGIVQELTDAQSHYLSQIAELQKDMARDWQDAVETVNEALTEAAAQTSEAFDISAALEDFADEGRAIAEKMAEAYRSAAEAAAALWESEASEMELAPTSAAFAAGSPFAAAPPPKPAAPDRTKAAKAMAVGTATMPRASWVNVPEPPAKDTPADEKKPSSADASGSAKKTPARPAKSSKSKSGSASKSGGSASGGSSKEKDG